MYRNPKLLEKLREIPNCAGCGNYNDGTVCAAHSNLLRHGKGRGIKAHDCFVAALCYTCHTELDQGKMSREEKEDFWNQAYQTTMLWLWMGGHIKLL